ncbi:hypothetical protein GCM10011414_29760 [Croceivirga lutea]|uniref:hypothetical protein n=1 Tax=Croceivirga lutea TaxID=1775167 RepID=UPI001639C547|nr:hypothetical protein [Croceivirga lutea]GGG57995.1 hypothetical protein GCM10011414_29760 [Croceivirga lutea]
MTTERKPSILETSHTLTMLILLAVVIGIGALFYYNWYDGYENRLTEIKKMEIIKKGTILEIEPIQHLSMHFDGNNVVDLGRKIQFQYEIDSRSVVATDRIEKTDLQGKFWQTLMDLKVGDSISVGISKKGKALIIFK